jgi:uncharacterized protein (DUF1778 family)
MSTKEPKRTGPGRPRIRPLGAIQIRCEFPPEEHAAVVAAAKAAGVPMATFVRQAAEKAARRVLSSQEGR